MTRLTDWLLTWVAVLTVAWMAWTIVGPLLQTTVGLFGPTVAWVSRQEGGHW